MQYNIEKIIIGENRRKVKPEKVKELAASIEAVGLLNPIVVYPTWDDPSRRPSDAPVNLAGGLHRLEAMKLLGHTSIEVKVIPKAKGELAEICENLHRVDLTKTQRDNYLRRYVELMQSGVGVVSQNDKQSPTDSSGNLPPGRPKSVITRVSEETGVDHQTVRRAITPPAPPPPPEDKTAAKEALLDFLLDVLTPEQWAKLISLMEGAGGSVKSKDLINWMAPIEETTDA